ncbi:hypothetical protein OG689_10945 [Kitasatospora sp. NBC_00240]|uniref:hypothetical protein n=1 Tax=Kitasatospora sp. NBC_00240 TaxID=2903567 RepID=UPI00225AB0DD|nr:hypothetical protein [Kitasatospora sp. NBC_00240]MCX5209801.1 hypothetical protein [Kitasatospora sp. NBC_00240]
MGEPIQGIAVTVMSNGEIRVTADLFPDEATQGVMVRGFSRTEAHRMGALLTMASAVSQIGVERVPVRGLPRRNSVTQQHLHEVSTVYRQAVQQGHPPTKTVAEYFGASHSTAARWVCMARRESFLGPASRGQAGEHASRRPTRQGANPDDR